MRVLRISVMTLAILAGLSRRADTCSVEGSGVTDAVQRAGIVAFGVVDSVALDEWGIIQSAVFIPEIVLKGSTQSPIRLHRPKVATGPCASIGRRPYESGDRVAMILIDEGEGSFEAPVFEPWLVHLSPTPDEAEQILFTYLSFIVAEMKAPIEIRIRGKSEYLVEERVAIDISVANRLSIPIAVSMDPQVIPNLPTVDFYVDGIGSYESVVEGILWVVPAKTTLEREVVLQGYFGGFEAGEHWISSYARLPTPRPELLLDYVGGGATYFTVTYGTMVRAQGWGDIKHPQSDK